MNLQNNLNQIKQLIAQSTQEIGTTPADVLLLAVTKQQSIETITEAYHYGIKNFAESYFQEAHKKINALKDFPICWHFIGPIQSNKTKGIASNFSWVHSINRLKVAQLLNEHRPAHLKPLNICLQINLIDEETKSGVTPKEATELAWVVNQLPNLKLRGLMTIPPPQKDQKKQYEIFLQLNQLMHFLNDKFKFNMDTLSMGMSNDIVPAIKAGSTIIRIGQALFGTRQG